MVLGPIIRQGLWPQSRDHFRSTWNANPLRTGYSKPNILHQLLPKSSSSINFERVWKKKQSSRTVGIFGMILPIRFTFLLRTTLYSVIRFKQNFEIYDLYKLLKKSIYRNWMAKNKLSCAGVSYIAFHNINTRNAESKLVILRF